MSAIIGSGTAAMRQFILAVALCAAGMVHAAGTAIYRSYESSGKVPTYSDRPINRSSQVFAVFDGTSLWPRAGTGPISLPQLAARRTALQPLLQRIAQSHGVHAGLLSAIIEVESGFNAQARSPKGAIGLMQVMPATAARYGQFDL